MSSTTASTGDSAHARLVDLARRHLWMHMATAEADVEAMAILTRGEGCYVWDDRGKRYLDGLAGLFAVNVGHGRAELAAAAGSQAGELPFFPIWGNAHPPAIELAARLAGLAPDHLNRVFFTSGGSEAVETAWKLARQYFRAIGQPKRSKVIARNLAYHGTTMGALAINGIPALRQEFEPLVPGARHCASTYRYRCTLCAGAPACTMLCADDIERAIVMEGPETVAAVFLEPVQSTGGAITPPEGYFQRVREICDRHGVLLVSDEVICAFGRIGHWFGCQRYDYEPDLLTFAKGLTSGYAPMGGVLVSDRVAEPFLAGAAPFLHGFTFGGHPVCAAVALANIDIMEREDIPGRVRRFEGEFKTVLDGLRDIPIVGDVRGTGYFYAIELVRDAMTKESLSAEECRTVLKGTLARRMVELGLLCRADDRAEPVVVLAPPLVAGPEQFAEIAGILRVALTEAAVALGRA